MNRSTKAGLRNKYGPSETPSHKDSQVSRISRCPWLPCGFYKLDHLLRWETTIPIGPIFPTR